MKILIDDLSLIGYQPPKSLQVEKAGSVNLELLKALLEDPPNLSVPSESLIGFRSKAGSMNLFA